MNRKTWCDRVCARIRFRPDRAAVRRELEGHLEDKREALTAAGLPEEEAECRALEAMGDPEEVGRQLNAVHKPWLGWLWLASKALVILLAVTAAVCLVKFQPSYGYKEENMNDWGKWLQEDAAGTLIARRLYFNPDVACEGQLDDRTIRVDRVAVWDNGDYNMLYGVVTMDGYLPWENAQTLYLSAVDSLGNRYENYEYRQCWPLPKWGEVGYIYCLAWRRTLTTWTYSLRGELIDPEAQWLELRYDLAGRDFRLRIPLKEGEGL